MAIVEEVVGGARTIGTQSTDHRRWYRSGPDQRHRPRCPGGDHPVAIGSNHVSGDDPEDTDEAALHEICDADPHAVADEHSTTCRPDALPKVPARTQFG